MSSLKNITCSFLFYDKRCGKAKKGRKGVFLPKKEKSFEKHTKMLAKREKV
jgi:hypothetical protein